MTTEMTAMIQHDHDDGPGPGPARIWWWKGVIGLDPEYLTADMRLTAAYAVIACAGHALHVEQTGRLFESRDPDLAAAAAWFRWLAGAPSEPDAAVRRFALRVMCETGIDPENILPSAEALYRTVSPRGGWQ